MSEIHKQGYCNLCRSRCGTVVEVNNDRMVAVRPDLTHPTGQSMCMKGRAAPELVHSPHRILYPMRRTKPKTGGDPGWERISWEQALSEVAARLTHYKTESGAESVVFSVTTPSGTPLSDSIDWIERFVRGFGSPNTCYATEVCNWHKDIAHAFTFGCSMPAADYENAQLIVLWGHNPANTWLAQANAIAKGRAKGAAMIVVDPRPTALAREADVWLPVRPGTDAALALGISHLLLRTQGFDDAFVRAWTNAPFLVDKGTGLLVRERQIWPSALEDRYVVWDEVSKAPVPYTPMDSLNAEKFQRYRLFGNSELTPCGSDKALQCTTAFQGLFDATAAYTPDVVESITGVPVHSLYAAVKLFSEKRPVAYHAWTGLAQHTNATQSERAVATLYALTGSFDRIGGNRQRRGPQVREINSPALLAPEQRAKALGLHQRPIGPPAQGWVTARDTYRAILDGEPYQIRAMMAFGTNLPVSQGDTQLAHEALMALEFHVHCDLFETPAARYADIFLPVNTPWEREGLRIGFEINDRAASKVQLRQQMVTSRGESRSDNEIVFDLACRLGMDDLFFGGSLEKGWNYLLEPLGVEVATLRKHPQGLDFPIDASERKFSRMVNGQVTGFATQTQRIELYSELLLRHGQPAVPSYIPPAESQRLSAAQRQQFPLILSSAKNGYYCHSQHRSLVSLRKRAPEPVIELSPQLAFSRDIHQGDWVSVTTRMGTARFIAQLTPALANDVLVAEYGWWQACNEFDRMESATQGPASSNYNNLISAENCDPISGSVPMRSFRCNVQPEPAYQRRQRKWEGLKPFKVAALRAESDGVLSVHFAPLDDEELPDFRPGQHIECHFTLPGERLSRTYSLTGACVVSGRKSYSIAVRHQRGITAEGQAYAGRVSAFIHTQLRVGDIVELRAPGGNFIVPRVSSQPLILVAGGIGITPFISLLDSLPEGSETAIWLYYANRNSATHAFKKSIEQHQQRLPHLQVFNHYRQPLDEDQPGVDFISTTRIEGSTIPDQLIVQRARVYMCGPPEMMATVRAGLLARGMPAFDIFSEIFRSPPLIAINEGTSYTVTFARSRKAPVKWTPANGTLLAFGEQLGIRLASGCRVGQCESCAVSVIAGRVRHLHGNEPEDPRTCLTCQAIPVDNIILDI